MKKKKGLAIILARSGSKGLKNKNIIDFCGKPLIYYTIEAAKLSKCFDTICVSTDSQLYADIAISFGADVPILRSEKNATDGASSWDAVQEMIDYYESNGNSYSYFCLLQPTSPLRDSNDIENCFHFFSSKKALFVESVVEEDHNPLWSNKLSEDNSLKNFIRPEYNVRRQDLPIYYRENGAMYFFQRSFLNNIDEMYGSNSYAFIMDKSHSIDIDCDLDLSIARVIYQQVHQKK